jgi:Ca-activated chloride channel homolog
MRKFVAAALFLSLLAASLPPAAAQSRARRVPATQPATQPPAPTPHGAGGEQQRRTAPTIRSASGSGVSTTPAPAQQGAARAGQPNAPEEVDPDEVINVNTTLVTIPVSVRDRDGRYMPNLAKQDFRVYEDDVEQRVEYFATTEQPFTVALVLDTSGSTRFRIDEIQDAAVAFVDQLRPADRVMVVSFDDDVRVLSEPTGDRSRLRNAIRSTRQGQGTRLYDAVDLVVNQYFPRIQGRKAIVLFTDGVDTTSRRASYESNMQDAEELDGLIYTVQYDTYDSQMARGGGGVGWPGGGGSRGGGTGSAIGDILAGIILGGNVRIGRGGGGRYPGGGGTNCTGCTREEYERGDRYLADIARITGARRYQADSTRDLNGAFSLVAEELRRQYSLGYYPSRPAQAGERRRIRVRVMRPELVVQARDSYISGQAAAPATASRQSRDQGQQQDQQRPTIRRWPLAEAPQR